MPSDAQDAFSPDWLALPRRRPPLRVGALVPPAGGVAATRIVDLGSGTGSNVRYLVRGCRARSSGRWSTMTRTC